MAVTEHSRTPTEIGFLELVDHLGQAAGRHDVSSVDEAVQMTSGFLDRLAHVVFAVEIEHIRDQIKGMLVVVDLRVKAGQVESICYVLLVDLAKVFIAARRYELDVG